MIRDMKPEDIQQISDIHKSQGFDYNMPEFTSPLFLIKKVREVNGHVVAAMCLRITAETYLLCEGSPVSKARAIEELQPEVIREAFDKGLDEIICAIPPEIAESFDPALTHMGWEKCRPWQVYQRGTNAISGKPSE